MSALSRGTLDRLVSITGRATGVATRRGMAVGRRKTDDVCWQPRRSCGNVSRRCSILPVLVPRDRYHSLYYSGIMSLGVETLDLTHSMEGFHADALHHISQ